MVYGNEEGHGVLSELEKHTEKMLADYWKERSTTKKRKLKFLNSCMYTMRQIPEGYMEIKKRFTDIYRTDIKHLREYHSTKVL